jgi:nucleoside-diphosphate-sugar epimerase
MKVLVTGASGFVGKHLVKQLKQQNIQVVSVGRKAPNHDAGRFYVVTDFNDASAWQAPLAGCDVVIHLAARVHVMKEKSANPLDEFRTVNVNGTFTLAKQAEQAGVKRLIYISSIGVNGDFSNRPFKENDKPKPHNAYTQSKLEAELALKDFSKEHKIQFVVIRPPLVYGQGAPGNFACLINFVKRETLLPLGAINNRRSFVYVENLVSLIVKCISHPAAANEVFFVSDGRDLSTTELLKASAEALGVKSRLLPVPQKVIEFTAKLLGKQQIAQRLCGNLQVDIAKARELLGWAPPYTIEEGLKKTAADLINKVNIQ